MWFGIISLFPDMFQAISQYGMTGRAVSQALIRLETWNPRDFTVDNYRRVDERPYGGGPGMVMLIEPLSKAVAAAKARAAELGIDAPVIYLSPQGRQFDERATADLGQHQGLILLCGRYEGIDERFIERWVDAEWSIGDYVLSGGELPAMVMIDAISRRIEGVLGHQQSAEQDSFATGLLDCPHYTRPEVYDGSAVPAVLLSGDHAAIQRWRWRESLKRTLQRRPDLLRTASLNAEQRRLLTQLQQEIKSDAIGSA
ncbi:tRNA (guanosine(37)-N1)-methyltransferase TrmD [Agitococcus lubricus]|uniref:tRNA (guanine-N(1)-)-methyltransferase n=1 Tax=Agitococcus lubricus TaxID=1077255 RepID=A0A2T5IYL4_9GAMM|nr:tRNA (guanosine(37)-N1)-methyltransferase TrmD [Agitococcus lubricus]PTQ89088.1 tRNA (guanine37-N(1)-) methyltransferase [Agitococcus lubricus]